MVPPWRAPLDLALAENGHVPSSRFLQLATVAYDGQPACRTIVFRRFHGEEKSWLAFATDARSAKMDQVRVNARAEVCWYFTETLEQFRIAGIVHTVTADKRDRVLLKSRESLWESLSLASKRLFLGARFESLPDDPVVPPPVEFAMLLLEPRRVDHLDLKDLPHRRTLYVVKSDGWTQRDIPA